HLGFAPRCLAFWDGLGPWMKGGPGLDWMPKRARSASLGKSLNGGISACLRLKTTNFPVTLFDFSYNVGFAGKIFVLKIFRAIDHSHYV
ncbi:MAG: hypothetical protein LBF58_02175, partial [Deltaproteobacteria bacterium]|nr:hypothetical protein [Deltaproteobacteria bacterium]